MTRHFLRDDDITPAEQHEILELATSMKADRWRERPLAGPQTVAVIFDKSSTRTRVSFAVGIADLGGQPLIISTANSQLGGKETPSDTARVLERMVAAIVWRTYGQDGLEEMAKNTTVPVVNALSDDFHPCQLLADLLTIREHKGGVEGLNVTILGDILYSRVARSNIWALLKLGANVTLCGPSTLVPRVFEKMGCRVTYDIDDAIASADVINLLRIQHERQRATMFPGISEYAQLFSLNHERLAKTRPDALIMHPGPINRGVEIASDIADCERSVILDQVTNGLAVRMAVLYLVNLANKH